MHRVMMIALGAAALGCGPLAAQSVTEELDTDGDGRISVEEWAAWRAETEATEAGYWSSYDIDQSGAVSPDEYATGEFGRYDVNADAAIDEAEYQARFHTIPPLMGMSTGADGDAEPEQTDEAEEGSDDTAAEISGYAQGLADYDEDGDTLLNPGEFWTVLSGAAADAGVRGTYTGYDEDQDGQISREEFDRGEFRRYDWDDDGMLSEEEFARYRDERPTAQ